MTIVTTLNNSEKLAKKIAKQLNLDFKKTQVDSFPDGDLYMRFKFDVKGKKLVIVESFQNQNAPKGISNWSLYTIYFAAKAAKEQGAKKVIVVAPYLAFMRQDKEFNKGEAINAHIMANLINDCCDVFLTVDPHLHRIPKMKDVFTNQAKNLTANSVIGEYVKKNFKNEIIVGPDWESYQWADEIAKIAGVKDTVLHKDRHSGRNVDVKMTEEIRFDKKNVIIVDDIISTGNTMIKAAIKCRKLGAKSVTAIGVHGLFVENGLKKMQKHFDKILTVNTIEHETNKIDITPVIVEALKKKV